MSTVLALWVLLSLAGGTTQALCLDFGGECSPAAAAPAGPCHDQTPDNDTNPACSSCVDILIPDDASARCNRPDQGLRTPGAAQALGAAQETLVALRDAFAATATLPIGTSPLHPFLRTTVLRI